MKKILIVMVTLISFILPQECEEPINVWFKISNDVYSKSYGEVIPVDMSSGYAYADAAGVYLIVFDGNTKEQLIIMFPFGYWESYGEIEKEFKDLEDYLRKNKGNGTEIKKEQ
jgi:hypothetical protein